MPNAPGNHKTGEPKKPPPRAPQLTQPTPERGWPPIERRRPEHRALFLADISRKLSESLDYHETLSTLARLAMPELGAWCIVDILDDAGEIRRLEVIHPDPSLQSLARELETGYRPAPGDAFGAPRMIDTQQPELVPEVSDELLRKSARDARHLEILRSLRMGSYMVVPLRARGRLLGTLTFVSAHDEQRYTPRDLLFAEDLASRAAIAMDNAGLYREARQSRAEALDAAARAATASRAKADFLGVMSHELHTPLNAIAGYAELLELGMRGPITPQQREAIARIRQAQRQLLGVVEDLLTFARTEKGRLQMHSETLDLNDVVQGVRFVIEPLMRANGLDYDGAICDPPMKVFADRVRVQHILVNLLSNAVKFSPQDTPIQISCENTGNFAAIHVTDKGAGIPAEKLEMIFQPFVQATGGLTRIVGGSGLGLAISRELARLMGGDVTVESEPCVGSRFTLTLPIANTPPGST